MQWMNLIQRSIYIYMYIMCVCVFVTIYNVCMIAKDLSEKMKKKKMVNSSKVCKPLSPG